MKLSIMTTASRSKKSHDNDELCNICNEWALNNQDFIHNFAKCTQCCASYHRQCILSSTNSSEFDSCSQIKQQCITNRTKSLKLITFIEEPYTYQDVNSKLRRMRNYYKSIQYKGIALAVGDVIEVRNENSETLGPQWPTNVAMIKEICHDQGTDIPNVIIFWYWRERELKWQIETEGIDTMIMKHESVTPERKKCIDYHIYLDMDYHDQIPMNTILHKVVVFDKFTQFKKYYDYYQKTMHGHSAAYYGELFFSAPNCSFGIQQKDSFKQFLQLRHRHTAKRQKENIEHNLRNAKPSKITNAKKFEDIPILQRLKMGLVEDGVTDSECTESEDEPLSNKAKAVNVKKKVKSKTQRKTIIAENKAKISDEAMREMNSICNTLKLIKGPNIGSKLYHFPNHLAVYQCIDTLFEKYDEKGFNVFINQQKQSFCRDIKYALYTKGQIVPLTAMKHNICLRFAELTQLKNKKRTRDEIDDGVKNGPNKKRRKV
eukprot:174117_1